MTTKSDIKSLIQEIELKKIIDIEVSTGVPLVRRDMHYQVVVNLNEKNLDSTSYRKPNVVMGIEPV